jgi:hypothetical protein
VSKGDIVLIPFPFTDLTGLKNRPALILFESESSVVVAFITSQLKWQDKLDQRLDPRKRSKEDIHNKTKQAGNFGHRVDNWETGESYCFRS